MRIKYIIKLFKLDVNNNIRASLTSINSIVDYFSYHNKNLTKSQREKLEDLESNLEMIIEELPEIEQGEQK